MGQAYSITVNDDVILNRETFLKLQKDEVKNNFAHKILSFAKMEEVDLQTLGAFKEEYKTKKKIINPVKINFDGIRIGNKTKFHLKCDGNITCSYLAVIYSNFIFHEDKDLSLEIKSFVENNGLKALRKYYDHSGYYFMLNPVFIPTIGGYIDEFVLDYKPESNSETDEATCSISKRKSESNIIIDKSLENEIEVFLKKCGHYKDYFMDFICIYN